VAVNPIFHRQALLIGDDALNTLKKIRIILFGIGGVGGWCAESLVRSGIGSLTIVDSDLVCMTNINRQLSATWDTVGRVKTDVLAERLRSINPDCSITAIQEVFRYTTAEQFPLNEYDYVLDAIDSLSPKVDLIQTALSCSKTTLFSSMGASCKLDPTRIRIGKFWDVEGCPLASKMRKRLRRRGFTGDFDCVWSDEVRVPFESPLGCGTGNCICPKQAKDNPTAMVHEWCSAKKQINGSSAHITATFGFFLSWLVIRDVLEKSGGLPKEQGRQ
jgi:tRNA A37 threonylcarbamoyladenosine dehydratase